jgi:uncharacterized protein YjbI with pentapeptide repeats
MEGAVLDGANLEGATLIWTRVTDDQLHKAANLNNAIFE